MNATGIVRKIDLLGRIVIPRETRQTLCIKAGDPVEFFYEDDTIFVKKYSRGCIFCSTMENVTNYNGEYICDNCKKELCTAAAAESFTKDKEKDRTN